MTIEQIQAMEDQMLAQMERAELERNMEGFDILSEGGDMDEDIINELATIEYHNEKAV